MVKTSLLVATSLVVCHASGVVKTSLLNATSVAVGALEVVKDLPLDF